MAPLGVFIRERFCFVLLNAIYHLSRRYTALENKTRAETFPKFPSVLRVIDNLDRNPPITARQHDVEKVRSH